MRPDDDQTSASTDDDRLTANDAAGRVGVSPSTLRRWASLGLFTKNDTTGGWGPSAIAQARALLKLRERGPVLIACPTCGRLQFDMDSVVVEIEERLAAYPDAIEVSVLGCAVNGIGEARHADFGITGAKDAGMIFSKGEPLKKVPTDRLVDELFAEIDRYYDSGKTVVRDEAAAAEAAEWLAENEDAEAMTPERLAAMEAEANAKSGGGDDVLEAAGVTAKKKIDEDSSPVAGRRFTRA